MGCRVMGAGVASYHRWPSVFRRDRFCNAVVILSLQGLAEMLLRDPEEYQSDPHDCKDSD